MTDTALLSWQRAFDKLNRCPWPGPRPIGSQPSVVDDDLRQLRGREREVREVAVACLSNDLVVVHGQSGVGKTSLIAAGLIPELSRLKKTVILCNRWDSGLDAHEVSGAASASAHVTRQAIADPSVALDVDPFSGDIDLVDVFYPDQLVVILDQFEEVIRNNPRLAHSVLEWVEMIAGRTSAKVVISLRSEYEHQLRDLHTKPFSRRSRIEISAISDESVVRTIIAGSGRGGDRMPIDPDAVEELVGVWRHSQAVEVSTPWDRPGLLHLQATLQVLWDKASHAEVGTAGVSGDGVAENPVVLPRHVGSLLADFEQARDEGHGVARARLLWFGLEKSVELRVRKCEEACQQSDTWSGVPSPVRLQTKWLFRDITEHLASAGYKTPQDVWELAPRLFPIPDNVVVPPAVAREIVPHGRSATLTDLARHLYETTSWLDLSSARWLSLVEADSDDRTFGLGSGPAAGLSDLAVVLELFRCYFFALEWLRASNIVQLELTRPANGGAPSLVATLTHDRYSDGLRLWRESQTLGFTEAVRRYTASRGADLHWTSPTVGEPTGTDHSGKVQFLRWDAQSPRPADQRLVANVNWRSCTIRDANFKDVVFVNCDFAGSTFLRCTFDGATFVNCELGHVDFVGCTIVGQATWPGQSVLDSLPTETVENPPSYDFAVPDAVARSLRALTDEEAPSGAALYLHSETAGTTAAILVGEPREIAIDDAAQLPLAPGGLVMCGGRLSSLTFRRCTFADQDATVALRHVAGTSLEICEQRSGRFDIFAAAIRGLAVTLPVGVKPEDGDSFTFDVRRAKVINTWFGVDLVGTARFDDCNVWQLVNASQDMVIDVTNSAHVGLLNAGTIDAESLPLAFKDLKEPENIGARDPAFAEDGLSERALHNLLQVSANIDIREDS